MYEPIEAIHIRPDLTLFRRPHLSDLILAALLPHQRTHTARGALLCRAHAGTRASRQPREARAGQDSTGSAEPASGWFALPPAVIPAPATPAPALLPAQPQRFTVQAWLNVGRRFGGYRPEDPLATDDDLRVTVSATSAEHAADRTFEVGNRVSADAYGQRWPHDVRSFSVGDVLDIVPDHIAAPASDDHTWWACTAAGWKQLPSPPPNPRVPLAGSEATSRTNQ